MQNSTTYQQRTIIVNAILKYAMHLKNQMRKLKLNQAIIIALIEHTKKKQQIQDNLGKIQQTENLKTSLLHLEEVLEAELELLMSKNSIDEFQLADLDEQLFNQKAELEKDIQDQRNQFKREQDLFLQGAEQEKKLAQLIQQLEMEVSEIEVDSQKIETHNYLMTGELKEHNEKISIILEQNKILLTQDHGFTERNTFLKSEIDSRTHNQQQTLTSLLEEEFINILMQETPFVILALRDYDIVQKHKIMLMPNSYSNINFDSLKLTMEFNKVISDNQTQELFIDWQDDMNIDTFTIENMKPCFNFIARPIDENAKEVRNYSNRKGLFWSINHDPSLFCKFLTQCLEVLQQITSQEVIKVHLQNRKDSLQFETLNEALLHLQTFNSTNKQDFTLVTFIFYLSEAFNIEFSCLNLMTQDDQLFTYLEDKIIKSSAYNPANSKRLHLAQKRNLMLLPVPNQNGRSTEIQITQDLKYKDFLPVADFICSNQPICYLLVNLDSKISQNQDEQYLTGLLKFVKSIGSLKVAATKAASRYYKQNN